MWLFSSAFRQTTWTNCKRKSCEDIWHGNNKHCDGISIIKRLIRHRHSLQDIRQISKIWPYAISLLGIYISPKIARSAHGTLLRFHFIWQMSCQNILILISTISVYTITRFTVLYLKIDSRGLIYCCITIQKMLKYISYTCAMFINVLLYINCVDLQSFLWLNMLWFW